MAGATRVSAHGAPALTTMGAALSLSPREMTVADLCAATGDSERVVCKRVGGWYARQHEPAVPRVRRAREPGEARWCYLVDAGSYARWLEAEQPAALVPGCDAARELGCLCVVMHTATARGAFVIDTCPLHGALVRPA